MKEVELQEQFGVSRAPIREAIRLLEADKLVVVSAYKNKHVRQIKRSDLIDIIPVLACLEGCAVRLAVPRISDDQIKALCNMNEEIREAFRAGNFDQCNVLNFKFHGLYVEVADNEAVVQALRPVMKRIIHLWVTKLYALRPYLFKKTIGEHEKIIETLFARNAERAEAMVREHIEKVLDRALRESVFDEEGNFKML